jgi:hypothetical protein
VAATLQSACLNFEKAFTDLFGSRLTLGGELGFSLQFAKLGTDQVAALQGYGLPEHIAALDATLAAKLGEGDAENLEYQFKGKRCGRDPLDRWLGGRSIAAGSAGASLGVFGRRRSLG